jgi:septum site-determining protein MinD
MSKIVSIHSFRGGTGKSNITANVAATLASQGQRVGIVDTDIQSPGIHVLFGLGETEMPYYLNDYLWDRCPIRDTAHEVTQNIGASVPGKIFLVPSSVKGGEINRILRDGYDVSLLVDGYQDLIDDLNLDILMIDTHPGINEETLLSIAISDVLLVLLRPDQQDFQGTSVTVEVARNLYVSSLMMVVNKVPPYQDLNEVKLKVERSYNAEVVGVLAHSTEMMTLASSGIFVTRYPDHPITKTFKNIAEVLMLS